MGSLGTFSKVDIFLWTRKYFGIKETYQVFLFSCKVKTFLKFLIVDELIIHSELKMLYNILITY